MVKVDFCIFCQLVPEVGSIPAISGIPAIEYRNRNSRYFFKNSVFHSIPFQNDSIPFQIAGILKTRAPKKKRKEKSIYRSGLANREKHDVIVGACVRTNTANTHPTISSRKLD